MHTDKSVDVPADWNALWRSVSEGLLGGLHHALNNRVATLSAISQVLGAGMPDASPLVTSLASEVDRLEATVSLLSLLRRARSQSPEPVQVPELTAGLSSLLAQHNDLKEVAFASDRDPGILPVYAERDLLTRVMLALMTSIGLEAERFGKRLVRVSYRGDEVEVTIRIESAVDPARAVAADATIRRLDARAASEAAQAMGGTLAAIPGPGGEMAYELRLPTLLAARRMESASRL